MAGKENQIRLPENFEDLPVDRDFLHVVNSRKSSRVYTQEKMSLLELSYLLWCSQGVKDIRGKSYATLRTVPSGGARHPFEVYMAVRKVDGLVPGYYHYLPLSHSVELLKELPTDTMDPVITESLCGQSWAAKANVVFYYSCVFYRAEWRYGPFSHSVILMDSGHVTENLYLACASVGLGGCAIAAVFPETADAAFGLDGTEERIFYAMPVGTVKAEDQEKEQDFYRFVKDEGL